MSRDFFCERCSLQFDKAYVFDLHLSLVHGEKMIEVKVGSPICEGNLQESEISETKFSYQTVHEKEKPSKCNECYDSFAQKGDLKRHVASIHEGKKHFKSEVNDASFSGNNCLTRHMSLVDEGKKPFKCNICEASFTQKKNLNVHMASVHEGKKPFKCNICDASS